MWVRGLKQTAAYTRVTEYYVAPHVGAWIETNNKSTNVTNLASHPMWVRGLKRLCPLPHCAVYLVAPHVGAWIETLLIIISDCGDTVAPHVGAWIETMYA